MRKKLSVIAASVITTMLLSTAVLSTNVFATPTTPYGAACVYIASDGKSATAFITKCSCNPVNNHLMAAIQVQYSVGNNYYWTPSENTYYFSEGSNVASEQKTISVDNINYARGWFLARCGSGSEISFYRDDKR